MPARVECGIGFVRIPCQHGCGRCSDGTTTTNDEKSINDVASKVYSVCAPALRRTVVERSVLHTARRANACCMLQVWGEEEAFEEAPTVAAPTAIMPKPADARCHATFAQTACMEIEAARPLLLAATSQIRARCA